MRDDHLARGANGIETTKQSTVRFNDYCFLTPCLTYYSYGVVRVHNEQCTYVLVDAQSAQSSLRTLFRTVNTAQLEGKSKAKYALTTSSLLHDKY